MDAAQPTPLPRLAPEITATLARRRFGLFGLDHLEAERVSGALQLAKSFSTQFDETWLVEFAHGCDAVLLKLDDMSPRAVRAALTSPTPVLVTGSSDALLAGTSAA